MSDFQAPTPKARALPRLSDFGSPFKLYELVAELNAIDTLHDRNRRASDQEAAKIHTQIESACFRQLQYYLGLLNIRSVQKKYLVETALPLTGNAVIESLDRAIDGEKELANASLQVVALAQKNNYAACVMAGRKAELEGRAYDSALFDPKDAAVGESAFEIYRRGAYFESTGNFAEAEASYLHATKVAPRFSLALRGYARMIRPRSPLQAAQSFAAALEDIPRLNYGLPNTAYFGTSLKDEISYRDFRVLILKDRAIAFPAVLGSVDFANKALRSRLHRFIGLLLLRLRLRLRRKTAAGLAPAVKAKAELARPGRLFKLKWFLLTNARPLAEFLAAFIRLAQRKRSSIGNMKSMAKRQILSKLRRSVIWALGLDKSLFDFVLVDETADRMKMQIDGIYDRWLTT